MPLHDYKRKRDFARTPEPGDSPGAPPFSRGSGATERKGGNTFVVQRHAARRLHYDLRLELGGVLKSWAVPKGPTLDPKEKRLAVHVEDHPLEYGSFEGTIPAGNYGAGVVNLWDTGTWELLGDVSAEQQLERGDFKFALHGSKLMGNFALVRIKSSKKNEWLLLKKPDFAAQSGWDAEDHLDPVVVRAADPADLPGARRAAMPDRLQPMLATLSRHLPEGAEWSYEIKWDGFRGLCFVKDAKLRVLSRNGNPLGGHFPELQELPAALAAESAILDGEIVAFDSQGRPSFSLMQQRTGFVPPSRRSDGGRSTPTGTKKNSDDDGGRSTSTGGSSTELPSPIALLAFDLLYLNGYDLRDVPLSERQKLLRAVLRPTAHLRLSESFPGPGRRVLDAAQTHGLEGVLAKRLDSRYESGRSNCWVKVKFTTEDEFVICGFTSGRRKPFSSLVLGYYDKGALVWAGNVGTGFSDKQLLDIYAQLEPLISKRPAFAAKDDIGDVTWLQPRLVCSVRYTGWGGDNHLRAPVFIALRPDRDAHDCVREEPEETQDTPKSRGDRRPRLSGPPQAASADALRASRQPGRLSPRVPLLPADKAEVSLDLSGRRLKFTNLNKVFYPADGYTKRDLINYYADVAPLLVPHLAGRPLSLKRYPNGIDSDYFFQKDASPFPSWLRTEEIEVEEGATKPMVICDDEPALLYLANLGCIDQNPWFSRVGSLDHPDFMVLDLDPYHCGYDRIVEAAQLVRRKLAGLELEGYPKTTGGDGMHIYVPIAPEYSYEQVRTFAEIIARLAIGERPELFTTPRAVQQREKGKVYFDYLQISWGKTISAPYVLRAHNRAPVATPLEWKEVKPGLSPLDFTLANVRARFQHKGDIFAPVLRNLQRLEPAMEKLERLVRR
ncbi:MAG TPA: DNA ligase D [Terriglobales bacterium]|nr:DNA ligase D [Terriglobales bacterium]